jgi:hypothetical protein
VCSCSSLDVDVRSIVVSMFAVKVCTVC